MSNLISAADAFEKAWAKKGLKGQGIVTYPDSVSFFNAVTEHLNREIQSIEKLLITRGYDYPHVELRCSQRFKQSCKLVEVDINTSPGYRVGVLSVEVFDGKYVVNLTHGSNVYLNREKKEGVAMFERENFQINLKTLSDILGRHSFYILNKQVSAQNNAPVRRM